MFVQVQYVSVWVQYIDIYYHINIHIHIHINIHIYGQLHHISVQAQYISVRAHPHHSAPFRMCQDRCFYTTHIHSKKFVTKTNVFLSYTCGETTGLRSDSSTSGKIKET